MRKKKLLSEQESSKIKELEMGAKKIKLTRKASRKRHIFDKNSETKKILNPIKT